MFYTDRDPEKTGFNANFKLFFSRKAENGWLLKVE